jgi:pyruvate/2-oxoglutarate dehydrogenase complex dihydrolipoamide dehydrogenase (E3) component
MTVRSFDAVLIGTGQANPALAGRLTKAGWKIAVVEKDLVGGTCVNVGCTPTKAMVASAKVAHMVRNCSEYGVLKDGESRVDLKRVKARKDQIVAKSRNGSESWLKGMPGCTLIRGTARFESADQVRVGDEILSSKHIFLNVGARPRIPDMPGVNEVPFLTSSTVLDLEELPEHLIIVGGSFVGLEFAQMYRRFGARVTVVERGASLISREDEDVRKAVQEVLESEGIQFRLGAECLRLSGKGNDIAVHVDCREGTPEVHGSHVLLAIGRVPNTDDLGLEKAGVATDAHGFIKVNEELRTNVETIWALGDCNGRGAFTHTSWNDFEIAAANLLDGNPRRVSDRIPVYALYVDPPLAHVGMTEGEVRQRGRKALVGIRPMTRVGRAIEKGETSGFMKVLVDAATEEILGATIFGVGGDEAIHCILTAMYARQPAALLRNSVHIHPTVAELVPTVFGELHPLE